MKTKKKHSPIFYVAHTFSERHHIRDKVIPELQKLGIETVNPFYEKDGSWKKNRPEVKLADELGRDAEAMEIFTSKVVNRHENIVETDLDLIRSVDGIIAFMPEGSTGTTCEIWTCGGIFKWLAKRGYPMKEFLGKPVFLVTTTTRLFTHPWIQYACVRVFRTERGLIGYLKRELPRIRQQVEDRRDGK